MKINRYVIAILIIVLVVFIAINCSSKGGHKQKMKTTHVDCEAGQSLAAIVAQSQKYTRIVVKGETCQDDESVIVTRDNIVIDGNGAILDGRDSSDPVIIVKAKNVVIKDLTVTRGMYGIVIKKEATAVLKNVNANGNSGSGIVVGKAMRLPNAQQNPQQTPTTGTKPITLNQSTDNPLSAFFNKSSFDMRLVKEARADDHVCRENCPAADVVSGINNVRTSTLCGIINVNDNADSGIYVNINDTLDICGTVNANNASTGFDQQHGLTAVRAAVNINSSAELFSQNNTCHGIWIINSNLNLLGAGQLNSENNTGYGLFIGIDDSDDSEVECNDEQTDQLRLSSNTRRLIGSSVETGDEIEIQCKNPDYNFTAGTQATCLQIE